VRDAGRKLEGPAGIAVNMISVLCNIDIRLLRPCQGGPGGPEQLVYERAPAPSAGPGEVLIAVHAAAITFAELTWDLEWTTRDGKDRTPVISSHEMCAGFVRDLGADRFISAGAGRPSQAAGGFDIVIDTVGGAVLDGSYGPLREGGRLVTLGAPPDQELAGRHKVHAMFFVVEPDANELARLAEMAGTGRLRTVISQTFPLAEGQKAFESGGGVRRPGKTVLVVR
jgi:NADPH:quinone reductase-like Zn-dependent oxidoreductase